MIIKKFKLMLLLTIITVGLFLSNNTKPVMAQKQAKGDAKQATQSAVNEGLMEASKTIVELTKKIYSASLFSPKDNDKLINLKLQLYDLWSKNPTNRELAKPMYDTAVILKQREMYDEATELLNIVIENFPPDEEAEEGTVSIDYSSKAQSLLDKINRETSNVSQP